MEGERERLESEVAARTAQLKELAQHLQTIREDERSRLARELHDELGALLTAAKLDVARLKSRLGATVTAGRDRAPRAPERDAQRRHRAEAPDHRGPAAVVAQQPRPGRGARDPAARVRRAQRDRRRSTSSSLSSSSRPAQLTVYRLVQEALTNVVKYAKATEVAVVAAAARARRRRGVSVRDNGVGFDTDAAAPGAPRPDRHALPGRGRRRDDAAACRRRARAR